MQKASNSSDPITQLISFIRARYPTDAVALLPSLRDGVWFLDLTHGGRQLSIEWSNSTGFGLTDITELDGHGYGERPSETFNTCDEIQARIASI